MWLWQKNRTSSLKKRAAHFNAADDLPHRHAQQLAGRARRPVPFQPAALAVQREQPLEVDLQRPALLLVEVDDGARRPE